MKPLRVAIVGAGFWARFQIAAWRELAGVELVGITNRTRDRAERLAADFAIPYVADTPERLVDEAQPEVLDVIAGGDTHRPLVELALDHRTAVICQKPLADTLEDALAMVDAADQTGYPLLVHENFRWQAPIRALKAILGSGEVGEPFRARLSFCSAYPVFENQPFLRELDRFVLMDVGTHVLDVARFLFGEATAVYCQTQSVNASIRGEDVATVVLDQRGITTVCELSYASILEREAFPEMRVLVEGVKGSVELAPDCWLRVTTRAGTRAIRVPPKRYPWADPQYEVVHASIVDCNEHMRRVLVDGADAETSGRDNLRTLRLVFAAYESAHARATIALDETGQPV